MKMSNIICNKSVCVTYLARIVCLVAFRGSKVRQSIAFRASRIVFQMRFNLDQKSSLIALFTRLCISQTDFVFVVFPKEFS